MYLKALTLRGFKSFASSTTLRLEPGITCIVGPNGSGKSNVVDALTWVMGEQGAKSLRGASMADVIFAGTSARTALGRAQVELTIDNSDGRLPIDYAEVTISRTLFRGGGSEYAINGTSARLLDVQELLSDTGMGRQMHVIVGQGQLDAVLRATPEERRGYIDEAAGVLKHRRRKERALRKLEAMDANLVRVLDLTEEIRRGLKPLARQAEAARRAEGVRAKLHYLRSRLLAEDLTNLRSRLEDEHEEVLRLRRQASTHDGNLDALRQELSAMDEHSNDARLGLQQVTELWHNLRSVKERLDGVATLAAERARRAETSGVRVAEASIDLAAERAAETALEAEKAKREAENARLTLTRASIERRAADEAEQKAAKCLRVREQELNVLQAKRSELRSKEAAASSKVEGAREYLNQACQRLTESAERQQKAEAQLAALEKEFADQQGHGDADLAAEHSQKVEAQQVARAEVDRLIAVERKLREEAARWQARRDTLAQSLPDSRSKENLGIGHGWVPRGTIDQELMVSRGWEDAIAALLGPFAEALILESFNEVSSALDYSHRQEEPLRALISGPNSDQPPTREMDPGHTDGSEPFPALTALTPSARVIAPVSELLDGAWLCDQVQQIDQLFASTPEARTAVTRDGVVFTRHSVRSPGQEVSSVLRLRAEWEEASEEAEEAAASLATITAEVGQARADYDQAMADTNQALRQLREQDSRLAQESQRRAQMKAAVTATAQEKNRAEAEAEMARTSLEAAEEFHRQSQEQLAGDRELEPEEFLAQVRQEAAQSSAEARSKREGETSAKLALHTVEEAERSAQRQAGAFRSQLEQLKQSRVEQIAAEERAGKIREGLSRLRGKATAGVERAQKLVEIAEKEKNHLSGVVQGLEERGRLRREQLESLQQRQGQLGESRRQAEVALTQTQVQYQQIIEHIAEETEGQTGEVEGEACVDESIRWNDHDGQPQLPALPHYAKKLLAGHGPHVPWSLPEESEGASSEGTMVPTRDEIAGLLAQTERQLARLGVVNPLAVEEHAALASRHEFLLEQVDDLRKSKSDLLSIIDDVDRRVKESFVEAFAETAVQFEHVFSVLFPGGQGRLSLTDPDDPLHTGVEIYARPAGKRVTRLSLLSGGERSLAALAYLVAIFKARPSPFYVMDEVEAALDDINLSRVLEIFQELRENSQLILVTHQKRTMEHADALYGVTMRQGTSAVASHRLDK